MTLTFTHPDLDAVGVRRVLDAAGVELDPPSRIGRVALDTFDGRLHQAGLRLVALTGQQRALLLTATDGSSAPAQLPWTKALPRGADDLPSGPFGSRVAPIVAERAILPVLAITSDESAGRRRDGRGKPVVVVVVHEGVLVEPDGTEGEAASAVDGWMITVDPVTGHDDDLQRLVARLATRGFVSHDGDVLSGVAASTGRSLVGRVSSPTVPLDPGEDALVAVRAVLANLARTIVDNIPGTLADLDPEFLHELRVAVRRTRSVLTETKGVVPKDVRAQARAAFKDLGTATGRTRDLDVYVLDWAALVAPLQLPDPAATAPVLAALEGHRRAAHAAMAAILDDPGTRAMLDDWQSWLADPGPTESAGPIGPIIASRTAAAQEVVLDAGRAIDADSPAEDLHDLRKDAKTLRYLLECFGSLYPSKERKAFVGQLKALQDNLGEHQDTEVQLDELRSVAHDLHAAGAADTDVLLTVGRLIDHLERRRQAARDEFMERFAAYDTRENRGLLADLLEGVARP